jgi:2-octaprenyl-6-methoxyphenol hydroxylase
MIRIEGRGPVALALRLLLEREGVDHEALIVDPVDADVPDWLGSRALAVSLGSLQTLARVVPQCAPDAILESRGLAAPITVVDVSRAGASGGTRIRATELGAPLLGAVFRYSALHRLLHQAIGRHASLAQPPHDAAAAGAQPLLTVIADGEIEQRARQRTREFEQRALLAEVEVERECPGWAYERFTSEGPLALLPLPEPGRRALVWCAPEPQCQAREALSEEAFDSVLMQAFGNGLGRIRLFGTRRVSAVTRRIGPLRPAPDQVAIGNAAQTLHPVAGQGLNLGLRDAAVLARVLGDWQAQAGSLAAALDRFERHRHRDRETLVASTDLLATLTGPDLFKPVHAAALTLIDFCTPIRHTIARGLMFGIRSR